MIERITHLAATRETATVATVLQNATTFVDQPEVSANVTRGGDLSGLSTMARAAVEKEWLRLDLVAASNAHEAALSHLAGLDIAPPGQPNSPESFTAAREAIAAAETALAEAQAAYDAA